jgi:hypothetical protein
VEYTEKTEKCSGCEWNTSLKHKLFHESGLAESIIDELNLKSLEEIHGAFANAHQVSKCFISLNERRTKIREENKYILPRELIELIGTSATKS